MERVRVTVPVDNTQMTKQAPASELTVEAQLKRYLNAGMLPGGGVTPKYGDFTNVGDFQEHLFRVKEAESQFMMLPAYVRKLCNNSPGEFVEAVYGGKRDVIDAMIQAGLMEQHLPEAVPEPVRVQVVNGPSNVVPEPPKAP